MRKQFNAYLKFGAFLLIVIISALCAGLYGVINDQITFTISPEYFTKFKYVQFGINPTELGGDRQAVVAIGFLATWWVGLIIGLFFDLIGLFYKDHKAMLSKAYKAIGITFIIAICMGVFGFLYGKFFLIKAGVNWWLPDNLIDKNNFIIVGSIHNFGYLGGFVGLLVGVIYLGGKRNKAAKTASI